MTGLTTPNNQVHQFTYNAQELLSKYQPPYSGPEDASTYYEYNADKDLTKVILPNGKEINYLYNTDGRLQEKNDNEINYIYSYNYGDTRPVSISKSDGVVLNKTYYGPFLGSEEQARIEDNTTIAKVSFSFDDQFRKSRITLQDTNGAYAYTPYYFYDRDGLMTQAGELSMKRSPTSGLVQELKLGKAQVLYSYDPSYGELSRIEYRYDKKMKLLQDFKRDALGRISEMYNESGRQQIHYDAAGRFTGRSQEGSTKPYSNFVYDKNGNRIKGHEDERTFTAEYDEQDRLIRHNNTTFTYDLNGNMATKTEGPQVTTYTYDSFGNLRGASIYGKEISYMVDGHDRRVAKLGWGNVELRYLWQDQLRLAAELYPDGTIRKQFIYAEGVNSPEYMIFEGRKYFFVKDHRGSILQVVDVATGEVKQQMKYSEFGEVLQDTNPGFQPFGFAGGLYDHETRLMRFGARDYDGRTGRWLSKDPIRFKGGTTNLYEYTLNDPINFFDPYGKKGSVLDVPDIVDPNPYAMAGAIICGGLGTAACGPVCGLAAGMVGGYIGGQIDPDAGELNKGADVFPPQGSCDPTRQSCPAPQTPPTKIPGVM